MENVETSFNEMQTVKRHFFALRNGVIADALRRAGSPFRIIFGLNLPQIAEIAMKTPHSRASVEQYDDARKHDARAYACRPWGLYGR